MPSEAEDRAAIIDVLNRNRIAVWTQDFDAYASCFVHADYLTRWNASRWMGIFRRRGWDDISARVRKQFADETYRNDRNAHETTIVDLALRINGDTAWATYDQTYPTFTHAGFRDAGGLSHEVRVLERHGDKWLIAFWAVMHGSTLRHDAPVLHLTADAEVTWMSPSAMPALEADDDIAIRNNRVRFRDSKANGKLQAALRWAANRDTLLLPTRGQLPIVVEAGEGLPVKVYWVFAEGGLIVFSLHTPGIDEDRLEVAAAIFGLSPAQKETARLVMDGLSLPEIAERMTITANTARTHLNRVFEKTGVRTQPALVRVLLSSAPPI